MILNPIRANRIIAQLREENRLLRAADDRRLMLRKMRDDRRRARRKPDPIITASEQNTGNCGELEDGA